MTNEKEFSAGSVVASGKLESTSKWAIYVNGPALIANRRAGATGKVVGFYRLSMATVLCVAHDSGESAAYTEAELECVEGRAVIDRACGLAA